MFKLNRMTDYAVVMMADMARSEDCIRTAPEIATATGVPLPTVAKLLKNLANAGLLASQRGAGGGYLLGRDPKAITVVEIIAAVEGPIALTACVTGSQDSCEVEPICSMRGNWDKVNKAVRRALGEVTLVDMMPEPMAFPPLDDIRQASGSAGGLK